jgi:carboxyl-terminal processing protease
MFKLRQTVLKLLCCLCLLAGLANARAVAPDARERRLAVFDAVWRTVNERYYDERFNGVDWAGQREKYRAQAAVARDTGELYKVLRQLVGTLRDSHTRLFTAEEKSDWQKPRYVTLGFSLREIEGLPVVAAVDKGSAAERAGLAAGDALANVDGRPATELFAERLAEQTASTPAAARWRAMSNLLDGAEGSAVKIEWRDKDGKLRAATLTRARYELTPSLKIKREANGVAVISFEIFTPAIALEFTRAWRDKLNGARALVFDLRGNGGGDANAMADIASSLLPAGTPLGAFRNRQGRAVFEPYTRNAMTWASDAITRFNGPVVLLTSTRTASAAEVFAASLRETNRVRVLGANTCGCVLAISRNSLPDGGLLDLSIMDYRTAKGTRLEAKGVAPDEAIASTRRDLQTNRDPALERALVLVTDDLTRK